MTEEKAHIRGQVRGTEERKQTVQKTLLTVTENAPLTRDVSRMTLRGADTAACRPGQFIGLLLDGLTLRRPISVCDAAENTVTILYKIVGEGTAQMARLKAGAQLDTLLFLGNGYDTAKSGAAPVLLGGGVGVPPLYLLAKTLLAEGKQPRVILGFNTAAEVFYAEEFAALGIPVTVTTADGSMGTKGFVTDALREMSGYTYTFACGPEPMLRAVYDTAASDGQYSFEERMGCGFGACMGCSCKTKYGSKRICKDGPVLEKGEIVW